MIAKLISALSGGTLGALAVAAGLLLAGPHGCAAPVQCAATREATAQLAADVLAEAGPPPVVRLSLSDEAIRDVVAAYVESIGRELFTADNDLFGRLNVDGGFTAELRDLNFTERDGLAIMLPSARLSLQMAVGGERRALRATLHVDIALSIAVDVEREEHGTRIVVVEEQSSISSLDVSMDGAAGALLAMLGGNFATRVEEFLNERVVPLLASRAVFEVPSQPLGDELLEAHVLGVSTTASGFAVDVALTRQGEDPPTPVDRPHPPRAGGDVSATLHETDAQQLVDRLLVPDNRARIWPMKPGGEERLAARVESLDFEAGRIELDLYALWHGFPCGSVRASSAVSPSVVDGVVALDVSDITLGECSRARWVVGAFVPSGERISRKVTRTLFDALGSLELVIAGDQRLTFEPESVIVDDDWLTIAMRVKIEPAEEGESHE